MEAQITPVTPPAVPETPAPVDSAPSIADHASQFAPETTKAPAQERDRDADGRFVKQHRSRSHDATTDDTTVISELTKRIRTTEDELGFSKIERKPGESQRVYDLRRRAEFLERLKTPPKADTTVATRTTEPPAPPKVELPAPTGKEFSKPKPTIQTLIAEGVEDPYAEIAERVADWRDEKKAWDQTQKNAQSTAQQHVTKLIETFNSRVHAFKTEHPDFESVMAPFAGLTIPPALQRAILEDDNGPKFMYHLAQQPDELDRLLLNSLNQDPTDELVAILRRHLNARVSAVTTGAAITPQAPRQLPKPPTPVRTGPSRTDEDPLAEAPSIRDHARKHLKR